MFVSITQHGPLTFLRNKKKTGKQKKRRKIFEAETIKRLSPRSKCYCFSHSRASRTQKFFLLANHGSRQCFSVFYGPSTYLKSISPVMNLRRMLHSYRNQSNDVDCKFIDLFSCECMSEAIVENRLTFLRRKYFFTQASSTSISWF